jgi:hypothetical protein
MNEMTSMAGIGQRATFVAAQRNSQSRFFSRFDPDDLLDGCGWRLRSERAQLNLNPVSASEVEAYFAGAGGARIEWHRHRNHALSSQVCCLNFLAPLARQPKVLAVVVESALDLSGVEMRPTSRDVEGRPRFVEFEWIGEADHLGEWPAYGSPTRGANATSADAFIRFSASGHDMAALIEWKYTESYGAPLADAGGPGRGHDTRRRRYAGRLFSPDGPLRPDLGLSLDDLFWEPFYQLARQQMLACRMEKARESGAEEVVVLHLSPAGNHALRRVTSPALKRFGNDAFKVFSDLLANPRRFRACTIERAFATALIKAGRDSQGQAWASYLLDRYDFLSDSGQPSHVEAP